MFPLILLMEENPIQYQLIASCFPLFTRSYTSQVNTPPKFNSSPLNNDGWKMIHFLLGPELFLGANCMAMLNFRCLQDFFPSTVEVVEAPGCSKLPRHPLPGYGAEVGAIRKDFFFKK